MQTMAHDKIDIVLNQIAHPVTPDKLPLYTSGSDQRGDLNRPGFAGECFVQDVRRLYQGLSWLHRSFSLSLRALYN